MVFFERAYKYLIYKFTGIHPRIYDFYYRHLSDCQQGSIDRDYAEPEWRDGAPVCLIFSFRYWTHHSALEMCFAKERQKEGYNVLVIGCDNAISVCDNCYYGAKRTSTMRCDFCSLLLRKICTRCGVRYLSMREYMKKYGLLSGGGDEHGREYEDIVHASWIRLIRSLHPGEDGEFLLKGQLIESASVIDRFFHHFLRENRVDHVVMLNGKFFAEDLLGRYCRDMKIPFISYERGTIAGTLMFSGNKPAIPADTGDAWKIRMNVALTGQERQRLHAYLDRRKILGNAEYVPFYTDIKEDKGLLLKKYSIDVNKKIIVLFTNSIWDSSVVGEDTIFSDMFHWISTVIESCRENENIQLIIRVHPVEVKIFPIQKTRDRVDDYIREKYGNIPNVVVIPPENEISPYLLMDIADIGLVYTSTTGLEMAIRNKPVIVASHAHYANCEFVYTPSSAEEYIGLMMSELPPRADQVDLAERYACLFYFEHMIPYDDIMTFKRGEFKFTGDIRGSTILSRAGFEGHGR